MNKKLVIGVIVGILIILGGVFLINQNSSDNNAASTQPSAQSSTNSDNSSSTPSTGNGETSSTNTITYTDSGFSPSTLTVTAGSKVTVKNDSSGPLQFDSDPHPTHTDDPELNIGRINPGESQTITVTTTGSHGYHNHLNTGDTGTIVVN